MSQDTVQEELPVSEMFYSIQGEGRYAGVPALFLRKAFCNLRCGGWQNDDVEKQEDMEPSEDATWVCDSIETFKKPSFVEPPYEVAKRIAAEGWDEDLKKGAHLILTGGEPLMPGHSDLLSSVVRALEDPFTEVESNGTFKPNEYIDEVVDQYNVSVKLSNSGMDEDRRLNWEAIQWHAANPTSDFKFVVSRKQDIEEIWEIITRAGIDTDDVYLMPAGYSQEELAVTAPDVAELCKEHQFKYSPRIHVDVWDQATGV